MSINGGMDKEGNGTYIYNGVLLSHKKERHIAICNNMVGHRDCYTE